MSIGVAILYSGGIGGYYLCREKEDGSWEAMPTTDRVMLSANVPEWHGQEYRCRPNQIASYHALHVFIVQPDGNPKGYKGILHDTEASGPGPFRLEIKEELERIQPPTPAPSPDASPRGDEELSTAVGAEAQQNREIEEDPSPRTSPVTVQRKKPSICDCLSCLWPGNRSGYEKADGGTSPHTPGTDTNDDERMGAVEGYTGGALRHRSPSDSLN